MNGANLILAGIIAGIIVALIKHDKKILAEKQKEKEKKWFFHNGYVATDTRMNFVLFQVCATGTLHGSPADLRSNLKEKI
jgi:hypothetical protein